MMSRFLHVIALISGGKDSFFSLLHCLHNNHHVVALANLHPAAMSETSDLNSYMYQTVGHTIIPLYADALGLPLYRRQISGLAINSEKDYYPMSVPPEDNKATSDVPEVEDETESLLHLLEETKAAHPTANAVSSGAILSTYQRTRIESVAMRLGLIPLSYLWQYPLLPTPILRPGGLLEDMAAVGLDARIIKVASGGLDDGLLWGSLKDANLRRKVEQDVGRFGGSVLGEGGEYETLVVSGPSPVWRARLEIGESAVKTIQAGGGEFWIAFQEGSSTVPSTGDAQDWRPNLKVPDLWDKEFADLMSRRDVVTSIADEPEADGQQKESRLPQSWTAVEFIIRTENSLSVSNIVAPKVGLDTGEQIISILNSLDHILEEHHGLAEDVVFTTLLLRSMKDFAIVNTAYGSLFTKPNPPARVTVACGDALPPGVQVMASFTIDLGPRCARRGLHVQSRSYWAPANIGPYSQAISVHIPRLATRAAKEGYLVYVAGQIPLVPASMEVLPPPNDIGHVQLNSELLAFWEQTCLSLQHLWRIGKATDVTWWVNAVCFITGHDQIRAKAKLAFRTWKMLHERSLWENEEKSEAEFPDIWDRTYGGQGTFVRESQDLQLPNFQLLPPGLKADSAVPGFLAVQVDELPRSCCVEWQALGLVQDEKIGFTQSSTATVTHFGSDSQQKWYISTINIPATTSDSHILSHPGLVGEVAGSGNPCFHRTVYTSRSKLLDSSRAQVVPCRSVWDKEGVELVAGVVQHADIVFKDIYDKD